MVAAPSRPVLIVEDNATTRAGLAALLNASGYATVAHANAERALAYLESGGDPCLIVLDLMLGAGMTGVELRAILLENPRLARIPVVVFTGIDAEPVPKVVAQLRKTVEPDELLAVIARSCVR